MFLIISAACLSLSVLFLYAALVGTRARKRTVLSGDFAIGSVYIPAVIGFGAMGLAFLAEPLQASGRTALTWEHVVWSLGILAGAGSLSVVVHRKLKKLPELAESAVVMETAQAAGHGFEPPDEGKAA